MDYRHDIDGLRAMAVLAVIAFHFGWLPNGFLGVDVFFVISGFLITGNIFRETEENRFSLPAFYLRRIRRIIPLVLFISLVTLLAGIFTMLPDDLENLSESVIATNLFANNILQLVTTGNYWDVVNEFKPLMHTWSLGVEEQFYLLYPLLLLIGGSKKIKWIPAILAALTIVSLILFVMPVAGAPAKYYLLPYRFFELSAGGLCAIYCSRKPLHSKLGPPALIALALVLCLPARWAHNTTDVIAVVALTLFLLMHTAARHDIRYRFLSNPAAVFLGTISFSLYMWHQPVLAFMRYCMTQAPSLPADMLALAVIIGLSALTYYFIEQPFRKRLKTKVMLASVSAAFIIISSVSLVVYVHAGVLHDVPELDISYAAAERNMHGRFNGAVSRYDRPFGNGQKTRVLVIGNSFARDWANVLLSMPCADRIDLSYINYLSLSVDHRQRLQQADYVFVVEQDKRVFYKSWQGRIQLDSSRIWCVGVKNFGTSNGIFYNHPRGDAYLTQRATIANNYLRKNEWLRRAWGDKYIDLIGSYADSAGTFPVFTHSGRFISQDCRHLTRAGAGYFAGLLSHRICDEILK